MKVIEQTPDEFIVELGFEPLHWWDKIYLKIYNWLHKGIKKMTYEEKKYMAFDNPENISGMEDI